MSVRRLVAAVSALTVLSACAGEREELPSQAPSPTAVSSGSSTDSSRQAVGSTPPVEPTARPVVEAAPPPEGWRVETWHYLTLNVPDTFGYGAPSQWCIATPRRLPRVQRPMDVHTLVGCRPGSGYGVSFLPADVIGENVLSGKVWRHGGDRRFPRGAWVSTVVEGRLAVVIVTTKRSVTRQIAASTRRADVDGNGCRTRMFWPTAMSDQVPPVGTLCRYDSDGRLERSERLAPADLRAARAAFVAAPDHPGHDHCIPPHGWLVVVRTSPDEVAGIWFDSVCQDGVSLLPLPPGPAGEPYGGLTAEVMHWALSPGWAQIMRARVPWPLGDFR